MGRRQFRGQRPIFNTSPNVGGYDWEEEMVKLHRHALANVAME